MSAGRDIPLDAGSALGRTIERVERAGPALRAMTRERIAAAITRAVISLSAPDEPLRKQAEASIPGRAGLSIEGVRWALETTLEALAPAALDRAVGELERLEHALLATPVRSAGIVLAGNVFTAGLRPIVWSLLCRVPVVVKVASTDAGLSELFALGLTLADEELGAAVGIAAFSRDDEAALSRMASAVDVLSVHGSDRTIEAIRRLAPATTEIVAHGHGLGVALVPRTALSADADLGTLLGALALDVAAYDQRGCLSPHAILVEEGGAITGREVARRLSDEALAKLARSMPRGPLPTLDGAVQVRWRGVAQALGELFEGDGWSVAHAGSAPLRSCPLHRNVAVHDVASIDDALARVAPFGAHLKVLAIAADEASRRAIVLPPGLGARICAPGQMQRPPFEAPTDGVLPWHGLLRLG